MSFLFVSNKSQLPELKQSIWYQLHRDSAPNCCFLTRPVLKLCALNFSTSDFFIHCFIPARPTAVSLSDVMLMMCICAINNGLCRISPCRLTFCCPKETQQISLSLQCHGLMWRGWRLTSILFDSNMVSSIFKTMIKDASTFSRKIHSVLHTEWSKHPARSHLPNEVQLIFCVLLT